MSHQTIEEAARQDNPQLQSLNLNTPQMMGTEGSKGSIEMILLSISKAKLNKHSFTTFSVCGEKNNLTVLLQHGRKEQHPVLSGAQGQCYKLLCFT